MTTAPVSTPVCTCRHHLPTARERSLLATLEQMERDAAGATGKQYAAIAGTMLRIEAQCLHLQRDRLKRASKACPAAGTTIWAKAVA